MDKNSKTRKIFTKYSTVFFKKPPVFEVIKGEEIKNAKKVEMLIIYLYICVKIIQ